MTYRDDHAAAIARIDALEHDQRKLAADNERLTHELAEAREWLGGPRRRAALLAGALGTATLFALAGLAIGRATYDPPPPPAPPRPPAPPQVTGVLVADGPR